MPGSVRAAEVVVGDVVMVDGRRREVANVSRHSTPGPGGRAEAVSTLVFVERVHPGFLTYLDTYIFPPLPGGAS